MPEIAADPRLCCKGYISRQTFGKYSPALTLLPWGVGVTTNIGSCNFAREGVCVHIEYSVQFVHEPGRERVTDFFFAERDPNQIARRTRNLLQNGFFSITFRHRSPKQYRKTCQHALPCVQKYFESMSLLRKIKITLKAARDQLIRTAAV